MGGDNGDKLIRVKETMPSDGEAARNPLDLWHTWSALVLLRAALRRSPVRAALLPPGARAAFRSLTCNSGADDDKDMKRCAASVEAVEREILRVREAIAQAGPSPLDDLAARYRLSPDELDVVAFLFSNAANPLFASLREGFRLSGIDHDGAHVGFLLDALFPDLSPDRMVATRRMFHPSAQLIARRLVTLDYGRCSGDEPDLLVAGAGIDSRVVNQLIGDNASYSFFSALLETDVPDVDLQGVILPPELKDRVVEAVAQWGCQRAKDSATEGLSFLFYGPPGTGKTLLAQALASRFRMPLIRMRKPKGARRRGPFGEGHWDTEDMVRFVLREARTLGGIAFFDECDDLFSQDSYESRCLLLELERHAGVVILATNSPQRLDRALDRRASLRVPFALPSREGRRRIWDVHLPASSRGADVDLGELADRYFFAGGYIRNAARLVLLRAGDARLVSQADLLAAADEQATHFAEDISNHVVSGGRMPELSAASRAALEGLVRVGRDALERGEPLRVCLRGPLMDELRSAAAALAWELRIGTLFCPVSALEGGAEPQGRQKERSSVNENAVHTIVSLLPSDCVLAMEDPEGKGGLDLLWKLSRSRPGIYLHLDGSGRRRQPAGPYHFVVELEPPEAGRRAGIWKGALGREGIACDDAAALVLATRHALRESAIEEVARLARWTALAEGRCPAGLGDVEAAAARLGRGKGRVLFG